MSSVTLSFGRTRDHNTEAFSSRMRVAATVDLLGFIVRRGEGSNEVQEIGAMGSGGDLRDSY